MLDIYDRKPGDQIGIYQATQEQRDLAYAWYNGGGSPLYSFASMKSVASVKHARAIMQELQECLLDAKPQYPQDVEKIEALIQVMNGLVESEGVNDEAFHV